MFILEVELKEWKVWLLTDSNISVMNDLRKAKDIHINIFLNFVKRLTDYFALIVK